MAIKIEKNVSNPNLREWIMPTSTTEIATDAIIASALVMGAVEKHFDINLPDLRGRSLPS